MGDLFGVLEDDAVMTGSGSGSAGGIKIFTDSKERVPSLGDDQEENPFLSRNASSTRGATSAASASAAGRATNRRKSSKEKQMEEASRNDEGMVYVL